MVNPPTLQPAGYNDEEDAEELARITNTNIQLARLVIAAELDNTGMTRTQIMNDRVEKVYFLIRIMQSFFVLQELFNQN